MRARRHAIIAVAAVAVILVPAPSAKAPADLSNVLGGNPYATQAT
jgi:hypothetical protein